MDGLANALSNLGINPSSTPTIESLTDSRSILGINQGNGIYTILSRVDPTSLISVNNAIDIYAVMITFYEDQLDLDKQDPQLDVVRDLMAARKCWVILHEQRRALMTGEVKLDEIWKELMRFWMR